MLRRLDIEVLRCVAISLVFLHHLVPNFFVNAYLGVDVFFVVSGYLIIPKLHKIAFERNTKETKLRGYINFYRRRFIRLVPSLAVALVTVNILFFFVGSIREIKSLVLASSCSLVGFANFCSFNNQPDYFDASQQPLTHLWSLAVEEQFYLILPILFTLGFYGGVKRQLLLVLSIAIFSVSLFFQSGFIFSYYSSFGRFFEFLLGGLAFSNKNVKIDAKLIRWLPSISLLIALYPEMINRSISTGFVLLSTFLILTRKDNLYIPMGHSIIHYLSERSYSIYLYHLPIIVLVKRSPLIPESTAKVVLALMAVIVTLIFAELSYRNLEKRLYFKLTTFEPPPIFPSTKVYLSAALFFLTIFLLGFKSDWVFHRQKQINFPKPPDIVEQVSPNLELERDDSQIILIGDSHAHLLSGELEKVAATFGYHIINFSRLGCEFILISELKKYNFKSNEQFQQCLEHNDAVLKIARKQNNKIILSQRSTVYQPEGLKMDFVDYRKVLFESLEQILTLENNLLILGPNPEFPISQSFFYKDVTLFQKVPQMSTSISISSMREEAFMDSLKMEHIARSYQRSFIDSIGMFCNRQKCLRSFEGQWLFTDESHLSRAGVHFIIFKIKSILRDFVESQ